MAPPSLLKAADSIDHPVTRRVSHGSGSVTDKVVRVPARRHTWDSSGRHGLHREFTESRLPLLQIAIRARGASRPERGHILPAVENRRIRSPAIGRRRHSVPLGTKGSDQGRSPGASVLSQRSARNSVASVSRISSALLCQTKGLGFSFHCSIQSLIDASSSLVERWVPRRSHCWSARRTSARPGSSTSCRWA